MIPRLGGNKILIEWIKAQGSSRKELLFTQVCHKLKFLGIIVYYHKLLFVVFQSYFWETYGKDNY